MDLYRHIRQARLLLRGEPVCLMLSFGKDAVSCMGLLEEFGIQYVPVYLYYVKGFSWTEAMVRHYEERFGKKVIQLPHWELLNRRIKLGIDPGPKSNYTETEREARAKTGTRWVVYGYRKTDSMERRAMLSGNEIDAKTHRIYPIADWSPNHAFGYCKEHKLPLPIVYRHGFHNIDTVKGEAALYIYNNYPDDWRKVEEQLPWAKAILLQAIKNL